MKKIFDRCEGFQWDKGNSEKSWIKHRVTRIECEQIFFNKPLIVSDDKKHSDKEKRWFALGTTDTQRTLFIVFTFRGKLIRIISARDMNKNEREIYNEEIKKNT